ncbi:MAG: TetR/AcrR family transcriptional regulator [Acidimicrobiia bacterium]|nr:TetR/AcrR family transcriptional regulator [Acidimicrobiia bacterium]
MTTTVRPDPRDESASDDGRHARRARNREAVISALLSLHDEGDLSPSTEAIAERAGLSTRSVFRYFADVDDLAQAAVNRQQERLAILFARPVDAAGTRSDRVRHAVAHRIDLLEAMGNVGRVARLRAPFHPAVADELRRVRALMRRQLGQALAPELDQLSAQRGSRLLAAVDVACSFEAYDLLRSDIGLSSHEAAALMVESVHALLDAVPDMTGESRTTAVVSA